MYTAAKEKRTCLTFSKINKHLRVIYIKTNKHLRVIHLRVY